MGHASSEEKRCEIKKEEFHARVAGEIAFWLTFSVGFQFNASVPACARRQAAKQQMDGGGLQACGDLQDLQGNVTKVPGSWHSGI